MFFNGVPYPKDSHFFVSKLPYIEGVDAEISAVYSVLRAPAYYFLDWIYWNPLAYFLATASLIFSMLFVFFDCAIKMSNNCLVSFVAALFLLPVMLCFQRIPVVGQFFTIAFPAHFGYQYEFTVRGIVGVLYILTVYFVYTRRFILMCLTLFISFFVHPNNALSIAATVFPAIIMLNCLQKRWSLRVLVLLLVVIFIGILPSLLKTTQLDQFLNHNIISMDHWRDNLLMSEATNYSAIFYASYYLAGQLVALALPIIVAAIFYKRSTNRNQDMGLIMMITFPVIMWGIFFVLELCAVNFGMVRLLAVLAPGQFGMKLVELAYVPMLFSVVMLVARSLKCDASLELKCPKSGAR